VVPVIEQSCLPIMVDVDWVRIDDTSAPNRARRVATALAVELGFAETRAAEIGIAVTELGTNLVKHARDGVLLVRSVRAVEQAAVEVVAVDSGPGIPNVDEAMRDGRSSTGTLGVGLGAVTRLADASSVLSEPGEGTIVTARFHRRRGTPDELPGEAAAGITRPIDGEEVCGDAYAVCDEDGRMRLMMCDGSGHGPLAAWAAQAAVRAFHEDRSGDPAAILGRIHTAMRGTRGGGGPRPRATGGTVRRSRQHRGQCGRRRQEARHGVGPRHRRLSGPHHQGVRLPAAGGRDRGPALRRAHRALEPAEPAVSA
jgi:anti-sigma regulatory factor (Ser/Thr protein kinase)